MKHLLFCILGLTLFTVVGCGKDNKSGKKSSQNSNPINISNSGLSSTSQQVVEKVGAWYNSTQESGTGQVVNIRRVRRNYNSGQNCQQRSFLGIIYQYCTSLGSYGQESVVSEQTGVALTQNGTAIRNKGNQDLNLVFSGQAGTLITAVDVSATASRLDFLASNGAVISYFIDRGYHSALNPVQKSESSQTERYDVIVRVY